MEAKEGKVRKARQTKEKAKQEAIDEAFAYVRGLEKIANIPEAMRANHHGSIREAWNRFDEIRAERLK